MSLHLPGRRRIYLTASRDSNWRSCSIFLCFRASDYQRILENGFCDVCTANCISGRISAHDDGCVDRLHCSFSPFGKRKLWTRTSILILWACRRRHKTRPHFCFRRMILVTTFRASVWSFVVPLSGFAADIILLVRHSSSSSFLPALMRACSHEEYKFREHVREMSSDYDAQNIRPKHRILRHEIDFAGSGCSGPLHDSRRKSRVFGIFGSPGFAGISGVPLSPGRWKIHADRLSNPYAGVPPHWVFTLSSHPMPVPVLVRTSTGVDLEDIDNIEPQKIVSSLPLSQRDHSGCMSTRNTSASLHSVRSSGTSGLHRSFASWLIRAQRDGC